MQLHLWKERRERALSASALSLHLAVASLTGVARANSSKEASHFPHFRQDMAG